MKKALFTLTLLLLTTIAFSQSVTDIRARVVSDKIQVDFNIKGVKYYQEVTSAKIFVSMNGGEFKGPLKEVTGNASGTLNNGDNTIIWDVLKEMPFTDEDIVFDVQLVVDEKDRSRKFFIALVGNTVTPLGLRFGQLSKTSWYVEARASLSAMESPAYNYDGSTINDYNQPGYYEFTGTGVWQAYSAVVGITQQLSWNTFIYAGVGYGVENYIMEINEYSYEGNSPLNNSWVKHEESSNSGVEIDAGIIQRFNHFIISAGGTALNFKSFGWTASVGYSF